MINRDGAVTLAKKKIEEAQTLALNELYEQGYVDGQVSVGQNPSEDTTPFSQADIDAAVAPLQAEIENLKNSAPVDTTPFNADDINAAVQSATESLNAQVAALEASIAQVTSDDESDKAQIVELGNKLAQIRAILGLA